MSRGRKNDKLTECHTSYEGGGKKYPTIFSETKIRALALLHH